MQNPLLSASPILSNQLDTFLGLVAAKDKSLCKILSDLENIKFSVKHTDLNSRVLNHWSSKGLLPRNKSNQDTGWTKFNFFECVFVQLLSELRKYGLPIPAMLEVKNALLMDAEKNSEFIMPFWKFAVTRCLIKGDETILVRVTHNGSAKLTCSRDLALQESIEEPPTSYLKLCLNQIVSSMFSDKKTRDKLSTKSEHIILANPDIAKCMNSILFNSEDLSEATLYFKDGSIKNIKKTYKVKKEKALELVQNINFGEVVLKKHNGQYIAAIVAETEKL